MVKPAKNKGIISKILALGTNHRNFLLYGVIGTSGALLDVLTFAILVAGFRVDPVLATVISTSLGITNNFLLNARFNFKKHDHLAQRFVAFYGTGVMGIAVSGFLLLVFSAIFTFDPTLVKIVSVPIVVLGQYFINKHLSFGDRVFSLRVALRFVKKHRYLLIVNLVFITLCLLLVRTIPLDSSPEGAPDEMVHYQDNVAFLLNERRLPISGVDDIHRLSFCRDDAPIQVPCSYSYQVYPALNYIISAASAKVFMQLGVGDQMRAARMTSVLWGVVFLNALYVLCRLFLRRHWAVLLMASVVLIPQVLFISSYTNQDIHSLAIATLVVYGSVGWLYLGHRRLRWVLYIAFGLLFSAKYNYFLVALVPATLLLRSGFVTHQWRPIIKQFLFLIGAAVVLSGFWFVRNFILYHDALGQQFVLQEMAKYHELGKAMSLRAIDSYLEITKLHFFETLFRSFFMQLGYMTIRLDESFYTLLRFGLLVGLATLFRYANRAGRWLLVGAGAFTGLAIAQTIVNSLTYDFQPQGRYLFVILPVIVGVTSYVLGYMGKTKPALVGTMLLTAIALIILIDIESILVMIRALRIHG